MKALSRILNARLWASGVWLHLRLWWRLLADPRVPETLKLLLPAAALVYVIWPADLMPDLLPLLGQLDDAAVVLFALRFFESLAPRQVVEEHLQRLRHPRSAQPKAAEGEVIDGEFRLL